MAKDADYIRLIHTSRWTHLRRLKLMQDPLCEDCLQRDQFTPATEVHHVRPVEDAVGYADKVRLMYDPHNLRALCHACHVDVHTRLGRSGREATRKRNDEHLGAVIKKFFE